MRDVEKQGVEVVTILEPVDTLMRLGDYLSLCEIKVEGHGGKFKRSQLKFIASSKMPLFIARNAPEALHKLKTRESIGQKQRDAIAGLLLRDDADEFRPGPIHRILDDAA